MLNVFPEDMKFLVIVTIRVLLNASPVPASTIALYVFLESMALPVHQIV